MLARGDTCNFYLSDLVRNMPWLNGMAIAGPNGRVTCTTLPEAVGLDLSDRPHYRAAQATGNFIVGNYTIGRLYKRPTIVVAYPTQAIDPNVHATVMASVDLQWLGGILGAIERRSGASLVLIDGGGTVLAGDPGVSDWIGKKAAYLDLIQRIGTRDDGTERAEGLDGVRRLFGFVRLPSSDARLLVGLNEDEILQRTDREITIAYAQVGFFGLLVLIIAWIGGERLIVQPIRSLARTAKRFGHGDLRARASREAWAKEFAPLTAALNDMAQRLAEREQELRAANSHLQELASSDALSGSPTGAVSTHGLPPNGSVPASSGVPSDSS
jgi:HAMP domain-containing protein